MSHQISQGISQTELKSWLENALKHFGLYKNQGINYTDADIAPIVMCTIKVGDQILIVKRANNLADANAYWSTVNGFIDQIKDVREIASNELDEELGLKVAVTNINVASSYTLKNTDEKRQYIVFPCLIELQTKPPIVLNGENTEYRWIKPEEITAFNILSDLPYAVERALQLSK
ncbi:MAG TPA: NUDIX domain-containing protein [Candidatus Saccharimonadales bacterium]|nr:NUDIX domain-containing protein [Candidatus Saccharimonadales bacterium]